MTTPSAEAGAPITLEELQATVARMEARLGASANAEVQALWRHYQALVPRFEQDLQADARDVALAKSAAAMDGWMDTR